MKAAAGVEYPLHSSPVISLFPVPSLLLFNKAFQLSRVVISLQRKSADAFKAFFSLLTSVAELQISLANAVKCCMLILLREHPTGHTPATLQRPHHALSNVRSPHLPVLQRHSGLWTLLQRPQKKKSLLANAAPTADIFGGFHRNLGAASRPHVHIFLLCRKCEHNMNRKARKSRCKQQRSASRHPKPTDK